VWEFLKNAPVYILLLVIGLAVLLVGVIDRFSIGSFNLELQSRWQNAGLIVTGVVVIVVSLIAQFRSTGGHDGPNPTRDAPNASTSILHTLDSDPGGPFPQQVAGAVRISILGRTAVNILGQYRTVLADLLDQGCNIRILFHPTSASSPFLYGSTPEAYKQNLDAAATQLRELSRVHRKGRLDVRTTKHPPTMAIVVIEKQTQATSSVRVQLYFFHARLGRDRPIIPVTGESDWYNPFVEEFESLWKSGTDWTPADNGDGDA
jgi:hypothetical protein